MNNTSEGLTWTLGDRLQIARTIGCREMTLGEFSKRIGISRGSIRNYEEMNTTIKLPALKSWAEITGYPVEWLTSKDKGGDPNVLEIARIRAATWMSNAEKEELIRDKFPDADDDSPAAGGRRITG